MMTSNNKKKLIRSPIVKKIKADMHNFEPFTDWFIKLNNKEIDVSELRNLFDGKTILSELHIFIRPYRKKEPYVYPILDYLKYINSVDGLVSASSLKQYKTYLDEDVNINVNTKADYFSHCKAFVRQLMSSRVIKEEKLTSNFKWGMKKAKKSFAEIASKDLSTFKLATEPYKKGTLEYQRSFDLDPMSAALCYFCDESMSIIYRESISEVNTAIEDIKFINEIIDETSEEELEDLRKIENFSNSYINRRTEGIAFSILYAHYGFSLPAVEKWIPGVYDYLKMRGWKSVEIRQKFESFKFDIANNKNNILTDLSTQDIAYFKDITDWRLKSNNNKSIKLCFKILYAKFGFVLPKASEWPIGLADFCKSNNWNHKRVYSAFFPDKHIQQPLLLAFLSHRELAPNVSSVFYYTYIDMFKKGFEENLTNIFIGKYRGSPINKDLNKKDKLVTVVKKYIKLYKSRLSSFKEGEDFMMKELVPIFGHLYRGYGQLKLRLYDPGIPIGWVHQALTRYEKKESILLPLIKSNTTGENFRPTHAVIDSLKGVNQGLIQKKLNHKNSSTTKIYTSRNETSSLIKSKSVGFQKFIIKELKKPKKEKLYLDMSTRNNKQYLGGAKRVVFSNIKMLAEWIAYRDKINKERSRLMVSNPERWFKYWEVKLAEYDVLINLSGTKDKAKANLIAESIVLPHLD